MHLGYSVEHSKLQTMYETRFSILRLLHSRSLLQNIVAPNISLREMSPCRKQSVDFVDSLRHRSDLRPISDSQLNTLLCLHLCPINLVVFKGSYRFKISGYLILGGASRLDAFSVYPFRTWLLCYAIGMTTDTPAVRPARSSRTKASSLQISSARAG